MLETTQVEDVVTSPKNPFFTKKAIIIAAVAVGAGMLVITKIASKDEMTDAVTEAVQA